MYEPLSDPPFAGLMGTTTESLGASSVTSAGPSACGPPKSGGRSLIARSSKARNPYPARRLPSAPGRAWGRQPRLSASKGETSPYHIWFAGNRRILLTEIKGTASGHSFERHQAVGGGDQRPSHPVGVRLSYPMPLRLASFSISPVFLCTCPLEVQQICCETMVCPSNKRVCRALLPLGQ